MALFLNNDDIYFVATPKPHPHKTVIYSHIIVVNINKVMAVIDFTNFRIIPAVNQRLASQITFERISFYG